MGGICCSLSRGRERGEKDRDKQNPYVADLERYHLLTIRQCFCRNMPLYAYATLTQVGGHTH